MAGTSSSASNIWFVVELLNVVLANIYCSHGTPECVIEAAAAARQLFISCRLQRLQFLADVISSGLEMRFIGRATRNGQVKLLTTNKTCWYFLENS